MSEKSERVSIENLTFEQIAAICDHTFLNRSEAYKASAGKGESPVRLRAEAFRRFLDGTVANPRRLPYAVCVRPEDVAAAADFLAEHGHRPILVASVVGFPDGSLYDTDFKIAETRLAIAQGAKEIDMVLNYDRFKAGDIAYAKNEVTAVVAAAHELGAAVKLILETSELNGEQIKRACGVAQDARADFVKTSTGFSADGARAEDLAILRANFEGGIKMSGGVKPENVKKLLLAVSGRHDGTIEMNPHKARIGESSLLTGL
jgi:deoxyribose-phosphate aldolase